MSPLEHYQRAELLLELAASATRSQLADAGVATLSPLELLHAAAVHARLAAVPAITSVPIIVGPVMSVGRTQ